MARHEHILSVFVASPSDLEDERNRLEDVIHELNTTWARELGIRLELVRWETHAYPGFAEDAQAVINDQIPSDYDIFIGMMWYRFGTPTGRAGSGTIEEFQQAKARFDRETSSVQLMIYFKDAPPPIAPTKLDTTQLQKVAEFRTSLGEDGGLYWSFTSIEDFEKLVRLHLARQIQSWRAKHVPAGDVKPNVQTPAETTREVLSQGTADDEPGLIDLMEQFEDEFATLAQITERIAAATVEIGERLQLRTAEVNEMAPGAVTPQAAKRLIAQAAADMDQYVHRMDAELPLFKHHLNQGMNALIQAATIAVEFAVDANGRKQVEGNLEAVRTLYTTLTQVEGQIVSFKQATASLPRMTTTLNKSKRAVVNVLERLIEEIRSGQAMVREAETSFSSIIKQE